MKGNKRINHNHGHSFGHNEIHAYYKQQRKRDTFYFVAVILAIFLPPLGHLIQGRVSKFIFYVCIETIGALLCMAAGLGLLILIPAYIGQLISVIRYEG